MRRNVLWISDKWTQMSPVLGLSNHRHNLQDTFEYSCPNYTLTTLHYDESLMYGKHIDTVIYPYCKKFNISIVFCSLVGQSQANPSLEALKSLQSLGVFVCMIWPDSNPGDLIMQDRCDEFADLNILLDYPISAIHDARLRDDKHLRLWTPESKFLYYPDYQDIEVSFIGSPRYPDRRAYIEKLTKEVPNIYLRGGQYEENLSPEGYASLIRRSKININFSKNPQAGSYYQAKGRVFESIASRTLLLEEAGPSTRNFFTPDEDYIEFSNADDLIDKINFYRSQPHLAQAIALKGYKKFNDKWSGQKFWEMVMSKIS